MEHCRFYMALNRVTDWLEELSPHERRQLGPLRERLAWFAQSLLGFTEETASSLRGQSELRFLKLIDVCRSSRGDMHALQRAAMEIGALPGIPSSPAVEALVSLLGDERTSVRVNVCQSLARIGGPEAKPALLRLLKDKEQAVRGAALNALYLQSLGDWAAELRASLREQAAVCPAEIRLRAEGKIEGGGLTSEEETNIKAFEACPGELVGRHPNEFLAFCEGQFVGHDRDMERLKSDLARRLPGKRVMIVEPAQEGIGDGEQAM